MGSLPACMPLHHVHIWCLQILVDCVGSTGTVIGCHVKE